MTTSAAVADVERKSVTFAETTYSIQELGDDSFTVLVKGSRSGRIVYLVRYGQRCPRGRRRQRRRR